MGMKEAAASGAVGGMTRSGPKRVAAGTERRHYNTVSGAQAVSGADTSSCQLEAISEN